MIDLAIIFGHYRDDRVTRRHYAILESLNPCTPVVAVHAGDEPAHLVHSLDVGRHPSGDNYHNPDTMIYRWFARREWDAERYLYVEWDTLATVPVREVYRDVWDAPAAAAGVALPGMPWYWWNQIDRLPPDLQPHAAGVVPLNGVMLSHDALKAVAREAERVDVFCELRLGTLLRAAGMGAATLPEPWGGQNVATPGIPNTSHEDGFFHPVKT